VGHPVRRLSLRPPRRPQPVAAFGGSAGASLAALLGHWLLTRDEQFDITLASMRDYSRLVLQLPFCPAASAPWSALSALSHSVPWRHRTRGSTCCTGGSAMPGCHAGRPLILVWQRRPDTYRRPGAGLK